MVSITATVHEEAVGVVAVRQLHRESFDPVDCQTLRQLMRRAPSAPVDIRVESQVDGTAGAVAQLTKLRTVQTRTQRTGGVTKAGLPQGGPIKQTFDEDQLATVVNLLPAIQPALAARQEAMRLCVTEAASVEVRLQTKRRCDEPWRRSPPV